jgi:radical SAM superfamily enzyme YgiQ (UPF0313 family)
VRVLLVSANRMRHPYPVHPIGLDYVAAALEPAHEVHLLDLCPLEDGEVLAALVAAVREHAPDAVGLSLRNVDSFDGSSSGGPVAEARRMVEALRSVTRAPVILGGAGFTVFPAELLAALGADFGVIGEGERARALLDALAAGADPTGLAGVIAPGQPAQVPAPLRPSELAVRGPPGRNPSLGFYLARGGMLGLQTQRGCAMRCIYCTYPLIEGRALRPFQVDAIAAEARRLEDAGARYLVLTDAVFNGSPEHALSVAAAFRRGGVRLPWGGFFAPMAPPPGFYDALREGGCTHVEFGTESLSDAVLPRLGKPFHRDDALRAHAAARAAGIHVAHFLLLGGPGESAATLAETFDGCEQLEGAALFFFCGVRIYPRTELWTAALSAGQIRRDQDPLEPAFFQPPGLPLPVIREELGRRAAGRRGWSLGAATEQCSVVARLHARGRTGPLWEGLAGA